MVSSLVSIQQEGVKFSKKEKKPHNWRAEVFTRCLIRQCDWMEGHKHEVRGEVKAVQLRPSLSLTSEFGLRARFIGDGWSSPPQPST